jgi:HTH-type transcriptional regulator, sugar sensing transcriptional regulator
MKENALLDIGFSKNEAKIYLSLLQLGPSTAGNIAAKANIHRTNTYDALDRLSERGLVTYIYKGNKKFFESVNPHQIVEILKDRMSRFEGSVLPSLLLNYKMSKDKNKAHIFEGVQGVKAITNDILKEGQHVYVFGIPKDVSEKLKSFINVFHKRRTEKKIKMYHIYDADARDRIAHLNALPYTEAKYIPHDRESPATTLVYGGKVAFVIWSEPTMSVLIESKRMAEQYTTYFKYLYDIAKKSS